MKKFVSAYWQLLLLCVMIFLGVYWTVIQPLRTQVVRAPQSASSQQTTFALLFAGAVILAIVLARRIRIEQMWEAFFAVLAIVGLFVSFFYSIPQNLPVALIYGTSAVATAVLIRIRQTHKTVVVHNLVMAWACIGVARVFGVQFSPMGMMLAASVVAGYMVFAVTSARQTFSVVKMLFVQQAQYGFVVTPRLIEWLEVNEDSPKSDRGLSIVDLTLPASIAAAFLLRGFQQFFFITVFATCAGVLISQYVRVKGMRIPPLPIIIGCCIFALYFSNKFLF